MKDLETTMLKLIVCIGCFSGIFCYWDDERERDINPINDPSCDLYCQELPSYMNWRSTLRKQPLEYNGLIPIFKTIDQGVIEGRAVAGIHNYNSFVDMYLGIPYAQPPIGLDRFKPAQRYQFRSDDTLDATFYRPACPQTDDYIAKDIPEFSYTNEDCLYLNVFQPNRTGTQLAQEYPVLVIIHGGMFKHGSAIQYPGLLLAQRDMVVVTFNYRLGALGFLSLGDENYPGNMGLSDQVMAIKWVKENIHHFNGLPDKVTILGHEAGAASVGIHLLSPIIKSPQDPYFHRAIMMSGSDLSQWAVIKDGTRAYARKLARVVGCDDRPGEGMIQCLRSKHPMDLVHGAEKVPLNMDGVPEGSTAGPFAPSVDDFPRYIGFLQNLPKVLRRNSANVMKIDIMSGFAKDDGVTIMDKNFSHVFQDIQVGVSPEEFRTVINNVTLRRGPRYNYADRVQDAIEFLYTWWVNPDNTTAQRKMLIDVFTDELYASGVDLAVKSHAKVNNNTNKKVYMYKFDYRSEEEDENTYWQGAYHRSDVHYLMGWPMLAQNTTYQALSAIHLEDVYVELDRNVSNATMRMWKDFAIYGDPTHQPLKKEMPWNFRNLTWYPLKPGNLTYFEIDYNATNEKEYHQSKLAFWQDYIFDLLYLLPYTTTDAPQSTWPYADYQIASYTLGGACFILIIILILLIYAVVKKREVEKPPPANYYMDQYEF